MKSYVTRQMCNFVLDFEIDAFKELINKINIFYPSK